MAPSHVHEASADARAFLEKLRAASSARTSSRKLLGGLECLSKETDTSGLFQGKCGAFAKEKSGHWCDVGDCSAANNYCATGDESFSGAVFKAFGVDTKFCTAENDGGCCELESGALAGTVVGAVAGVVLILTIVCYWRKCCCFKRKGAVASAV